MARQIIVELVGDAKKFNATTDQAVKTATTSLGKLDGAMKKMTQSGGMPGAILGGLGIGAGLGVFNLVSKGIGAVVDVIGDSISAASDQAEAMSKVNVVFGTQSGIIKQWAQTSATAMGMSTTAALDAAGTLGNLFDGLGLADDASVKMSKSIVQLAADLGSFNNVPTADALLALRSGLLGEAEPMRKFGSALTAARVEAYALANGLAKTKGAVSEAAKVQARYALILEDTKNAQGDFALTSEELANSQKSLDAEIVDLQGSIGRLLQGPAKSFTGFLRDVVHGLQNIDDALGGSARAVGDYELALQELGVRYGLTQKQVDEVAKRVGDLGFAWGNETTEADKAKDRLAEVEKQMRDLNHGMQVAGRGIGETFHAMGAVVDKDTKSIRDQLMRTRRVITSMTFWVSSEADTWKTAWERMAAWATEPMWSAQKAIKHYAKLAASNAAQAADDGHDRVHRRWVRIGKALKNPIVKSLIEMGWAVDDAIAKLWQLQGWAKTLGVLSNPRRVQQNANEGQQIPKMAEGGIIPATPGGRLVLAGESGPEAIVPLDRGGSNRLGNSYNITVNVAPGGDLAEAGRQMVRAISSYEKRDGRVWRSAT